MFAGQSNERKVTRPADPPIEQDKRQWWRDTTAARSFYDEVGGHQTFHAIVSRFYQLVREDEILSPASRTTSTPPRSDYGCSSNSIGAARGPTPISGAIRDCG